MARRHTGIRREAEDFLAGLIGDAELLVAGRERPDVVDAAGQAWILVEGQNGHTAFHRVLQHGCQRVRPVDRECGPALFDRQPRGALVGAGDRRIRPGRGRHRFEDPQRIDGGGPVRRRVGQRDAAAVLGEHPAAATGQQRVEPDHQAFALIGLHGDPAGLPRGVQSGGLAHHPIPGSRRLTHQIGAIPKQLGVGRDGGREQLAFPARRRQRARQDVGRRVGFGAARGIVGQRQRPTRLGELRRPHHIERHHVQRAVATGQPPRQLQTLLAGRSGQTDLLNGEAAIELLRAILRDRGERRAVGGRGVEADHQPVDSRSARGYRGGDGERRQRDGACPAYAPTTTHHRSHLSCAPQIAKRANRSRAFSAFCGSHSTS